MPKERLRQEKSRVSNFEECHKVAEGATFGSPPDVDQERRLRVRDFLVAAMKSRSWENHFYRANPRTYNIETALLNSLGAFDYAENLVRVYHLKQIRRFLFSRFAFVGAFAVNRRLRKVSPSAGNDNRTDQDRTRESWFWLNKDFFLLRMSFSVALGFGAVFGSGGLSWLSPLARSHYKITWLATILLLAMDWFLIHLNVRNQIGKVQSRWHRSIATWAGCLVWIFAFLQTGHCYYKLIPWLGGFSWSTAWLVGSIAFLLGLLGQFFFGKAGSIAEPL